MDLVLFAMLGGAVATGAAVWRYRGDPVHRLRGTPVSLPAGAADGADAVLRGTVALAEPGADLASPISRRQCVMWMVTFDELGIGGDFRELGRSVQGRTFLLTGPDGVVRVVPEHSRIHVPGTVSLYAMSDLVGSLAPDNAIKLARNVCKKPNYPYSSSLRVTEYAVLPGMDVVVRGHCVREPDPGAPADVTGYRTELPTRPVVSGTRRSPLLLCDYRRVSVDGQ